MTGPRFPGSTRLKAIVAIVALVPLAGCAPAQPTPTPLPRPTEAPSPTPSPTPTPTPTSTPRPTPTPTPIPYWDTRTSSPEAQGMDSQTLVRLFDAIAGQELNVHSVIVIRNGVMVTEAYFSPYHRNRRHRQTSCTKSFLSALVGIAIDEGSLELDDLMTDAFPDRLGVDVDPRKREITVEHLLLMRSGLDWPETSVSYSSGKNVLSWMMSSRDWVQFVLDRPMATTPGTVFNYSTGDSQLLGAMLEQATGTSLQAFARTALFEPLGIPSQQWSWSSDPQGVAFGGGGLQTTPRVMATFGTLYLQGGVWEGEQVVPAEWVEASVTPPTYGYHWWRLANGGYAALGYGGQRIAVVPDLDLVVVITGNFSGATSGALVDGYVVPAAWSPEPLDENPQALAELEARIQAAASSDP